MIYGKLPIVFLGTLASEKSGSTNSLIASYILDNLDQMADIGIQQLAKNCNVSISSISRFCRDIGLDSFSELRMIVVQANLNKGPRASEGNFAQRLDSYANQAKRGISKIVDSVQEESIQALVQDLATYSKVATFGLMKAETAALNLQSDLLMYGKQVYTNLSYKEQMDYILKAEETDLIILFSFTNAYFDYASIKPFLKKKNHPRIWMITGKKGPVPSFVHQCLTFDSEQTYYEHPSQLNFMALLIAQEYNYYQEKINN